MTLLVSTQGLYRQIFKLWRRKRFGLFMKLLQPRAADVLLDVGGYPGSWTEHPQLVGRIDTLNVHAVPWSPEQAPQHHIRTLVGDGCALPFADGSYDIGFSNSVIEHVGSWAQQQRFAAEIRRVGRALWVQTPAYECPFEPHYLAPLIHYLSPKLQRRVIRWCTLWGWLSRPAQAEIDAMVQTTRLLRKTEVQQLFPDCEIITEKLFGLFPKSYVAVRKADR